VLLPRPVVIVHANFEPIVIGHANVEPVTNRFDQLRALIAERRPRTATLNDVFGGK
jgi:hypothetical protein